MPVLTGEQVRALTGRTEDSATPASVVAAVALVASFLPNRRFEPTTITEHLRVRRDTTTGAAVLHPSVRPVLTVTAPDGATVASSSVIRLVGGSLDAEHQVTYTAGWDTDTLPGDLAVVIADVSVHFAKLNASRGRQIDPSVDSASFNGTAVRLRAAGVAGLERMSPGATAVIRRWRGVS